MCNPPPHLQNTLAGAASQAKDSVTQVKLISIRMYCKHLSDWSITLTELYTLVSYDDCQGAPNCRPDVFQGITY